MTAGRPAPAAHRDGGRARGRRAHPRPARPRPGPAAAGRRATRMHGFWRAAEAGLDGWAARFPGRRRAGRRGAPAAGPACSPPTWPRSARPPPAPARSCRRSPTPTPRSAGCTCSRARRSAARSSTATWPRLPALAGVRLRAFSPYGARDRRDVARLPAGHPRPGRRRREPPTRCWRPRPAPSARSPSGAGRPGSPLTSACGLVEVRGGEPRRQPVVGIAALGRAAAPRPPRRAAAASDSSTDGSRSPFASRSSAASRRSSSGARSPGPR